MTPLLLNLTPGVTICAQINVDDGPRQAGPSIPRPRFRLGATRPSSTRCPRNWRTVCYKPSVGIHNRVCIELWTLTVMSAFSMCTHTCYASPYVSAAVCINMYAACGLTLVPSNLALDKILRPFLYHHSEPTLLELQGPLDAVFFKIYDEDMRMASSSLSATVLPSKKGNLETTFQSINFVGLRDRRFPAPDRYVGVEPISAFRPQHAPPMRSFYRSAYPASWFAYNFAECAYMSRCKPHHLSCPGNKTVEYSGDLPETVSRKVYHASRGCGRAAA